MNGWDLSAAVPPIPDVPSRLAGLDCVADAEKQTRWINRRILAAFPDFQSALN